MSNRASSVFEVMFANHVEQQREYETARFTSHIAKCESQSERIMAASLMWMCVKGSRAHWLKPEQLPGIVETLRRGPMSPHVDDLWAQTDSEVIVVHRPIWGPWRPDFLILLRQGSHDVDWVVVESGTPEERGRTKNQIDYDRQKNRELQTNGAVVLHFSMAEIYRDAGACLTLVERTCSRLLQQRFDGGSK